VNDREIAESYGLCPVCGGLCKTRERRLNGNDRCVNGHVYPSRESVGPDLGLSELLNSNGWTVANKPLDGHPAYQWRSPSGLSGDTFRSHSPHMPPEPVIRQAWRDGILELEVR
jgi:hypothetical protein